MCFLLCLCLSFIGFCSSNERFPVLDEGRYKPADVYARNWLKEYSHASSLIINSNTFEPIDILWNLHFFGLHPFQDTPLFWINKSALKGLMSQPFETKRLSYQQLKSHFYTYAANEKGLLSILIPYYTFQHLTSEGSQFNPRRFELKALYPGIWLRENDEGYRVIEISNTSPWKFLKKGDVFNGDSLTPSQFLKHHRAFVAEYERLSSLLRRFQILEEFRDPYVDFIHKLKHEGLSPSQIAQTADQQFSIFKRLKSAGELFKALPSRLNPHEWYSLSSLKLQHYDQNSDTLLPIRNFSAFSEEDFQAVREAYLNFEREFTPFSTTSEHREIYQEFISSLEKAYEKLAGNVSHQATGKALYFPSVNQLKVEQLYISYPWILMITLLYAIGLLFLALNRHFFKLGLVCFFIGFLGHTSLLLVRCYILNRPPVANMFETTLYVPWIAVCLCLIFYWIFRYSFLLYGGGLTAIILLTVQELIGVSQSLDPIQAVLDSQFWLMIHVLLVVGSYGVFILGGLLAHFYIFSWLKQQKETPSMKNIVKIVLQTLYIGTMALILGTILGGIWAAQSWGRFWDWDPKESWAFISSCYYLAVIHAYRFGYLGRFGLMLASIGGLIFISFTWYGVNYLLGTGMHSYGFGSGGEGYYLSYVGVEVFLILLSLSLFHKKIPLFK